MTKPDDLGQLSWHRSQPAERVAERRQLERIAADKKTCMGCESALTKTLFGQTAVACKKRIRPACIGITESRRCDSYKEKEA